MLWTFHSFDYGMLDLARRLLLQVLDALRPQIRAGVPLVGIEPSCLAVFRDELRQLLPHDEDAKRLAAQSFTLAELLGRYAPRFEVPRLEARALVQRHCHHYAVMGFDADRRLLERIGLDVELLDSGCCGMAGSFGFEAGDHYQYQVSVKQGERVLLPGIREAPADAVLVADGFSCRTQIQQGSDRRALHLAEVLRVAMHAGDEATGWEEPPEARNDALDARLDGHRPPSVRRRALTAAGLGTGVAGLLARRRHGARRSPRSPWPPAPPGDPADERDAPRRRPPLHWRSRCGSRCRVRAISGGPAASDLAWEADGQPSDGLGLVQD